MWSVKWKSRGRRKRRKQWALSLQPPSAGHVLCNSFFSHSSSPCHQLPLSLDTNLLFISCAALVSFFLAYGASVRRMLRMIWSWFSFERRVSPSLLFTYPRTQLHTCDCLFLLGVGRGMWRGLFYFNLCSPLPPLKSKNKHMNKNFRRALGLFLGERGG